MATVSNKNKAQGNGMPTNIKVTYTNKKNDPTTPTAKSKLNFTSSSTSSGSVASTPSTANTTSYADAVKSQYDAYQEQLAAARAAQQAAADAAYSANKSNLQSAYKTKTQALKNNLNNTLGSLLDSYNNSQNNINNDATKALQEAYVNRMLAQKNLSQNMAAQGLNGGASESTLASLLNNYGNARNNIETTQNTNLANLENTYNTNVANANTEYNNAYANANDAYMAYLRQIESDRANAISNSYANQYSAYANLSSDYTNALMDALKAQQAYTAKAQSVTNAQPIVNTTQGADKVYGNGYTNNTLGSSTLSGNELNAITPLYRTAQNYKAAGYSDEDIEYNLANRLGASYDQIAYILNMLANN